MVGALMMVTLAAMDMPEVAIGFCDLFKSKNTHEDGILHTIKTLSYVTSSLKELPSLPFCTHNFTFCVSRNYESPVMQRFVRERVESLLPPHCNPQKNKRQTLSPVGRRRRSLLNLWRDTESPLPSSPLLGSPKIRGGSLGADPHLLLPGSVWTGNRTLLPSLLSESRMPGRGLEELYSPQTKLSHSVQNEPLVRSLQCLWGPWDACKLFSFCESDFPPLGKKNLFFRI